MEILNIYLCGIVMPIFLIVSGVYFIFKLKFFYILHPIKAVKEMSSGGFKSLSLALAGTLGIGNIVGVASAISSGGAGAIFWMWISAFLAMSIKYIEVVLAMRYRQKDSDGKLYGGAPYYIQNGLKDVLGLKISKILASIFAILCIINSLSTGNLVQVNAVTSILPISKLQFGLTFFLISFIIILGGLKRIGRVSAILIPVLTVFYLCLASYIIILNFKQIPYVFFLIFKDAFSVRSAFSGVTGYGIARAIRYGVTRGILSNEAGCGTSPTAHASSLATNEHSQGCLGIFEVFVDTIVLCSITAIVIILAGANQESPLDSVVFSFQKYLGIIGKYGIIISSLLFSLATVVCQYYYGAESLRFITNKKSFTAVYTLIFGFTIFLGALIPMTLMWQISDLVIALMTVFNLFCILMLQKSGKI